MRRTTAISLAAALAFTVACRKREGSSRSGQPAALATIDGDGWRADLAYLARELPRRHKNLFFAISSEEFAERVAALDGRIPSLAEAEIIVELSRLVASVGDGHTGVVFDQRMEMSRFPVAFYWFSDGLYITSVAPEHSWALTYSSALLNAVAMKTKTHALAVGESPGQSSSHYGEVKFLRLPNSQVRVTYSTKYFEREPLDLDLEVQVEAADYYAGRDPVLAAILAYSTE